MVMRRTLAKKVLMYLGALAAPAAAFLLAQQASSAIGDLWRGGAQRTAHAAGAHSLPGPAAPAAADGAPGLPLLHEIKIPGASALVSQVTKELQRVAKECRKQTNLKVEQSSRLELTFDLSSSPQSARLMNAQTAIRGATVHGAFQQCLDERFIEPLVVKAPEKATFPAHQQRVQVVFPFCKT
jgi:hypothetical protein